MENVTLTNATQKIARFNDIGLHYNLVANQIYKKRFAGSTDPFAKSFFPYIIAGLISFDMGRLMGAKPYEVFASRLNHKLQNVSPLLKSLMNTTLTQINLQEYLDPISEAYNALSAKGNDALHMDSKKSFHVGATKILHFLNPKLFIIVDRNAARAFRLSHNVPFRNTTPPGHSAERYIKCMGYAQ
ncbi:MAG TPA: hypothetical protein VJ441_03785, partial [Dehalococcoidia bacterium]|nr:hypothetical protein [Dehalococcoidia bacterium]